MDCIKKYLDNCNSTSTEEVIYKLLKDKTKTKNLRDKIIIETFDSLYSDNTSGYSVEKVASEFRMSCDNVRYIIRNRCLVE